MTENIAPALRRASNKGISFITTVVVASVNAMDKQKQNNICDILRFCPYSQITSPIAKNIKEIKAKKPKTIKKLKVKYGV
ncbi:hypothetical protein [Tengunoibacter tsumagoiensis]|uniref:Uncharacterized protein n=1 Tax=Tengunoibacter tsumagoiensis TaxID=2014871 RepID=A0A401ZZ40_9CHLR|nr:hypothetical protein [Tengunoibacter tsumagoiensis]GCE12105.1 hypothetical protein KTT_19640 [Tengunoibacter tsumagoiensis]